MPIQEEPMKLEFVYSTADALGTPGVPVDQYKVKFYRETNGVDYVEIQFLNQSGSEKGIFRVDFFAEVTDFLRKKGAIPYADNPVKPIDFINNSTIPLPQVTKKDTGGSPEGDLQEKAIIEPFTSFDISQETGESLSEDMGTKSGKRGVEKEDLTGKVIVGNKEVSKEQIIARPVIKGRTEEESAEIRGETEGKKIKRAKD